MDQNLTIQQLAEATSCNRTQIDQWISRGYFNPEAKSDVGKARAFTKSDAVQLGALAELVRLGIPPGVAWRHTRHLYGYEDEPALLVVYQRPVALIPTSERGTPPPKSEKPNCRYDPGLPSSRSRVVRLSKLQSFVSNRNVHALALVNLDRVEARITTVLVKSSPSKKNG